MTSPSPCTPLKTSDLEAYELCRYHVDQKRVPVKNIDRGVPIIDFKQDVPKRSFVPGTRVNGKIEAGEIFEYAKTFRSPWHDPTVALMIEAAVKKISSKLLRKGLSPNTIAFNKALAMEIAEWATRPRASGGLGIIPNLINAFEVAYERTISEIVKDPNKKSHCTELTYVLYEAFRIAGLNPSFQLVFKNDLGQTSLDHVCAGIEVDPANRGKVTVVDLTLPKHQWFNAPHRIVVELSKSAMIGIYNGNRAIALHQEYEYPRILPGTVKQRIKKLFEDSLKRDPFYPGFVFNMAHYYNMIEPNAAKVLQYLKGSLALYPKYKKALELKFLLDEQKSRGYRRPSLKGKPLELF